MIFPKFNDEMGEVYWALKISKGDFLPLVGSNLFNGPFYYYLLAFTFKIFGYHYFIPRLITVFFCSLITPVIYLIGKEIGLRKAGLIATILFSLLPAYYEINSRFAWSASLTPFFASLTLLFLLKMRTFSGGKRYFFVLLFFTSLAITLQTHPSAIPVGLASGAIFLIDFRLRQYLKKPIFYLGTILFLLISLPYIFYNIKTPLGSFRIASTHSYSFEGEVSPSKYQNNLSKTINGFLFTLKGKSFYKTYSTPGYGLLDIICLFSLITLCTVGFLIAERFIKIYLLLILFVSLLLLPVINSEFLFRYYAQAFVAFFILCSFSASRNKWLALLLIPVIACYVKGVVHFCNYYDNPVRSGQVTNKRIIKALGNAHMLVSSGVTIFYPSHGVVNETGLENELLLGNSEWQKTQFILESDGITFSYFNKGDLENLVNQSNFQSIAYISIVYGEYKPIISGFISEEIYDAKDFKIYKFKRL